MTKIEKLVELCPCEVEFGEWWYVDYGAYDSKPFCTPRVQIEKAHPLYMQEAVLAHETGHALCDKHKCRCRKHDGALGEFHAQKFALSTLLNHNNKLALIFLMDIIEMDADEGNGPHERADRQVMKLKLWEKCKKFTESGE